MASRLLLLDAIWLAQLLLNANFLYMIGFIWLTNSNACVITCCMPRIAVGFGLTISFVCYSVGF